MNYIYDKKYPVTSVLLILTTLVFVGMLILRGFSYAEAQTVFEFGAVYSPTIIMNPIQIWRLFSAIFVHIGLEHFVVNVLTLYFIGRQAEDIFGSRNFFLLYMMSGLMGNIFVFFFSPDTLSAGASTALFGLFASIVTLQYVVRDSYIQQLGQSYMTLIVVNIIFSFMPGISLAGHLGGLIGGILCAVILPVKSSSNAFKPTQRWLVLFGYLALAALLIFLGFHHSLI